MIWQRFTLIIASVVLLFSCEPDVDSPIPYSSDDPDFSATVNGSSFSPATYEAYNHGEFIEIRAGLSNNTAMSIVLNSTRLGEYSLTESSANHAAMSFTYLDPGEDAFSYFSKGHPESGGYVQISEFSEGDSSISGSFEFTLYRPLDTMLVYVTEGEFNKVSFHSDNYVEEQDEHIDGSNLLSVMIDGMMWEAPTVSSIRMNNMISINASDNTGGLSLGISIDENITPGNYELDELAPQTGIFSMNASAAYTSSAGMLSISNHNMETGTISGSFNFEAENSNYDTGVSITNGSFSIEYDVDGDHVYY